MGPNIIQQENRMKNVPDAMLRQMLMQMTQAGKAGTPEFILAAGELQGRKEARQQAMAGQGNPQPVIADLLMGDAMPPQMPVLPENAGGIAALPAPNMEGIATLAGGGLVAFSNGGRPFDTTRRILEEMGLMNKEGEYIRPYRTEREKRLVAEQQAQAAPSATGMPTMNADNLRAARQADNAGLAALAQMPPQTTQGVGAAPAAGNQPTVPPTAAPTAGVAPATVPTLNYAGVLDTAGTYAKGLLGAAPTVPGETTTKNVKEAVEADRKLFEELGIADPTKMRREQLEKEIAGAKTEKEQAGWMRLAEFGFNWASQNGPALQAAAKAGAAVAPGLLSDLKELKKVERDQQKELAGLAALDAQAQRDMTTKARDRLDRQRENAENRLAEYNKNLTSLSATIGGQIFSSQTQLATTGMTTSTQREVAGLQSEALKIERDLARKDSRAKAALDAAEQSARDIMDPTERITAIKRYFSEFYNTAYGAGAGAPAPDLAAQARAELARRGNK
jgi:hypothetical protein